MAAIQLRLTFVQNEVNIPNLNFLNNQVLFAQDKFLVQLILMGDCAVSISELPFR